jgi:hypothetical protein
MIAPRSFLVLSIAGLAQPRCGNGTRGGRGETRFGVGRGSTSGLGIQLVGDAAGAVLVLAVVTVLGMYKPWGRTAYGRRKLQEERPEDLGA